MNTTLKRSVQSYSSNDDENKNWNDNNITTLIDWTTYSAFNIEALDQSIKFLQGINRWNTIISLLLSSSAGTISTARFGLDSNSYLNNVFNYLFTIMSFSMTIFAGIIKVYQVQEKIERLIKLKQEWIEFSLTIAAEFQLPLIERQDALILIKKYKSKYLDLLKTENEIPQFIKNRVIKSIKDLNIDKDKIIAMHSLSNVIYEINNEVIKDKEQIDRQKLINNINDFDLEFGLEDSKFNYQNLIKADKNGLDELKNELFLKEKHYQKEKLKLFREIHSLIDKSNLPYTDHNYCNINMTYNELIQYKIDLLDKIKNIKLKIDLPTTPLRSVVVSPTAQYYEVPPDTNLYASGLPGIQYTQTSTPIKIPIQQTINQESILVVPIKESIIPEQKPVDQLELISEQKPVDQLEQKPVDQLEQKLVDQLEQKLVDQLELISEQKPVDQLEQKPVDQLELISEQKPVDQLELILEQKLD